MCSIIMMLGMCGIRDFRSNHDELKEICMSKVNSPPQKGYLTQIFTNFDRENCVGVIGFVRFYFWDGNMIGRKGKMFQSRMGLLWSQLHEFMGSFTPFLLFTF